MSRAAKGTLPVRGTDLPPARPRSYEGTSTPARVRPYSLTGGRTRSGHDLLVETFVGATGPETAEDRGAPPSAPPPRVMPEVLAIVALCRRMRTVAEIAALLRMPLGVVRVLLGDLADQGRIRVYGTGTGHGTGRPDRALLERVLSGLRRL